MLRLATGLSHRGMPVNSTLHVMGNRKEGVFHRAQGWDHMHDERPDPVRLRDERPDPVRLRASE